MKVAVIGFGGRGALYTDILFRNFDVKPAAVCDTDLKKLEYAKEKYFAERTFSDSDEFFAQGKLADVCIVSTQDNQHAEHAVKAMRAGYDLLLEKPIASTKEDCYTIYNASVETGRKVFVCHVLRYAPFFDIIKKELSGGEYGEVATVNLTENVSYWHQAHSYVRGNWAKKSESSPMIIAKCCHDLDLIYYFIGKKCKAVSSMGQLSYFTEKNAPKDAAERCADCRYVDDCAYSAVKFYLTERAERGSFAWPVSALTRDDTVENVREKLNNSNYGKCVYKCGNDVVDHQVVNMLFEGGITAHLTMTAFSKECYRDVHVHCEKGEIYGNMLDYKLHCNVFGGKEKIIDASVISDSEYGHGGGDVCMIREIVEYYQGKNTQLTTTIEHSMQSHIMGFKAEESREKGGILLEI